MADYGAKASLDDNEVEAAGPDKLAFSTQYGAWKLKLDQTPSHFDTEDVVIGIVAAGTTIPLVTIAHGLGYVPSHLASVKYNVSGVQKSSPLPFRIGTPVLVDSYCDDTNLVIQVTNYDVAPADCGSDTYTFKYYIFVEEGV